MKDKGCTSLLGKLRAHSFRIFFFASFFLLTGVFAVSSLFLIREQKKSLSEKAYNEASKAYINLQGTLSAIQSNAVFVGSLNSVSGVVGNPGASLDDLKAVSEDICSFTGYSDYSSVELFFNDIEKVYVSEMGLYSYENYFDGALLSRLLEENLDDRWLVNQDYSRYYGAQYPMRVLTYVRKLPLYNSSSRGFIAIHMDMNMLRARILDGVNSSCLTVSWQGETIIGSGLSAPLSALTVENSVISCTAYVTHRQVWEAVWRAEALMLTGYLLLVLLAFILAGRYSASMGKPAKELLRKLGIQELDAGEPDVYGELEDAIDALSGQISDMTQTMRQNRPLVREQLILQLVCQEGDFTRQLEECARCGITFPNPLYAVILLDLSDLNSGLEDGEREQLRLLCRESCLQAFGELGQVYGANGENGALIFFLNAAGSASGLEDRIRGACQAASRMLQGVVSFGLRFSAGLCEEEDPRPYRAYLGARRGLSYTSADSEGFVAFSRQDEDAPYADSRLLDGMARAIFQREPQELDQLLARHRCWYLEDNVPLDRARQAANLCLCSVFSRLLQRDYNAGESGFSAAAKKLSQAESAAQCDEALREYFHSLIHSHEKVSDRSYSYVKKALAYIEENYSRNFAIPEMAEELSINPVYLNKIFKLAQGKTVSEYLNFYRISVSLPMMEEESRTIAEISAAVGYPDVRGYIRFFKKFYDVTPSEYRRQRKSGEGEGGS